MLSLTPCSIVAVETFSEYLKGKTSGASACPARAGAKAGAGLAFLLSGVGVNKTLSHGYEFFPGSFSLTLEVSNKRREAAWRERYGETLPVPTDAVSYSPYCNLQSFWYATALFATLRWVTRRRRWDA